MIGGVTIKISKENHYNGGYSAPPVQEQQKVYYSKYLERQFFAKNPRIKAKRMIGRLNKKTFRPCFVVTDVDNSTPYAHKFIMKPYNF